MRAVSSIFTHAIILLLLTASPLFAAVTNDQQIDYEQPTPLTGRIYDGSNTNKLLFTFRRTATRTNSTVNVSREFRLPDGNLAALEKVTYESGRLVEFELNEPPSGAHARAIVRPDPRQPGQTQIAFEYSEGADSPKRVTETLQPNTLVADMIAPFIHSHWEQLIRGDVVKFRFIAVARRETVGFKLVKDSESTKAGKRVIRLRMQPTSFLIAAFVDPLYFNVERDRRHYVLDYTGRTTPRIEDDGRWKDVVAFTVFDWPPAK